MDSEEFRVRGKEVIDYVATYHDTIESRSVVPDVLPGYLRPLLPPEAPMYPEKFEDIMQDYEDKIMAGTVHWAHPHFHAYFPTGTSYASFLGNMLCEMTGSNGFSWKSNPVGTELEILVLEWLAKAIDLPAKFIDPKKATGVIQNTASDAIFVAIVAARHLALEAIANERGIALENMSMFLPELVAYCSQESHSCVEKAARIALVKLRILETNDEGSVTAETLEKAIAKDEAAGLRPFFYSSILGSTSQTSFDKLTEIGPVCKKRKHFWLHVDAAYAGSVFICPEFRYLMEGMEYANSFNVNPIKWMLVHVDLAVLWVDDVVKLTKGLIVDPIYLKGEFEENGFIDRRHMQVALSRRNRALKLWFTFRLYGITGIQDYIRNHVRCAKYFENLVCQDDAFEVNNNVRLGLVCFRLKGDNKLTEELLANINHSRKLHMVPTKIKEKFTIRFTINYEHATFEQMDYAWSVIKELAAKPHVVSEKRLSQAQIKFHRRQSFTRSVSREDYEKRSSSLYDGATPILVLQEDGEELNVFDDEFSRMAVRDM